MDEVLTRAAAAYRDLPEASSAWARQLASARAWTYDLIVRDLELDCRIGVYGHEKGRTQRVRVNVRATVRLPAKPRADDIGEVVSYEYLVDGVRRLASGGHVELVETLAIRILDLCFDDARVARAAVTVEKLEIVPEAAGVGISLERSREEWE